MILTTVMNTAILHWFYLSIWFSVIAFAFGIVYLGVAFLIRCSIELEGKIRTEKVWRVAIREYLEKRSGIKLQEKDLKIDKEG